MTVVGKWVDQAQSEVLVNERLRCIPHARHVFGENFAPDSIGDPPPQPLHAARINVNKMDGQSPHGARLASGFRRADVARLVAQCLLDMGYSQAANVLEQEAGVKCLSEPVSRFREAVLRGDW